MLFNAYSAFVDTICAWNWSTSPTMHKYGRWKTNQVFPEAWIMLSYLLLSSLQVHGFADQQLHRFDHGHPTLISTYNGFDFGIDTNIGSGQKRPRFIFLDLPTPIEDPFPPVEPNTSDLMRAAVNPFELREAKYLKIQGSLISDIWMEYMGQQSATFATATLDDDEQFDATNLIVFKSETMTTIRSLQDNASDELVEALLSLPRDKVLICTATSPNHLVDM